MVRLLSKWKGLVTSVLGCDAVFICFRRCLLDFWVNAAHIFHPEDGRNAFLRDIHVDNRRTDVESYSRHNICRTSPVIQFSSFISRIYKCSTFLRYAPCQRAPQPRQQTIDLFTMHCPLQVERHFWAVALDWSGRSGVASLLLHLWREWFACLSQSLILLFWKLVQIPLSRYIAALPFLCHAALRAESLTLPLCPKDFSETLNG